MSIAAAAAAAAGLAGGALYAWHRCFGPEHAAAGPERPPPAVSRSFKPTMPHTAPAPVPAPPGMVWIPGGEFSMGSNSADESLCGMPGLTTDAVPIHQVEVDGFWMDATEVTNDQFAAFVAATGYRTVAETPPARGEFPEAPPENLVAGSTVFTPVPHKVDLGNYFQWWRYVPGADWRHPTGPGSTIGGRGSFPVVQVAWEDAMAYAAWAGKRLPTEAEWEFAARGGAPGQRYPWGDELMPEGRFMANLYEGEFPLVDGDTGEDGFQGIAPAGQYPANGYGLHDMAGNVWEWCLDWYRHDYYKTLAASGTVTRNPQGPGEPWDPADPGQKKRVHRGGSFLCTDQYCTRYIVGSRGKGEVRTASNHLGFRCVKSGDPSVASAPSR